MAMSQSEIRTILNKFLASAKKETGKNPSYKELYSYVKEYSKDVTIKKSEESDKKSEKSVRKKSVRKNTTEPGGIFDASLCHCRVWNTGLEKQCSNKPKEGNMCGLHMNAVEKYGGWSLGLYCDDKPSAHLFDCGGNSKKGDPLPWKDIRKYSGNKKSSNSKKIVDPVVMKLKDKYEQAFGKRPRGPKASDIDWLRSKLDMSSEEESDSDDSDNEDNSFKDEAKNDDDEAKNDDNDEAKNDDDDEAKNDDDKVLPEGSVKEIKYEGVTYFKSLVKDDDGKYEITNVDEDDIIGYMDEDDIIEFEEGYDEIHEDHEDYSP